MRQPPENGNFSPEKVTLHHYPLTISTILVLG